MKGTPVWEHSKENAAPLERGRNVKLLEKSMSAGSEEQRRRNEIEIERFEKLVRPTEASNFQLEREGDDPLIHWLSYIKYHQENNPSDTHAQFLLFERCMRSLCRVSKYANDPRFVRVCCLYAEKTERSSEVFQHLYQQKIGTELAMFWMAWSFMCEKQEDYQFAKKILEKGIRKEAKPKKQLETRFRQFQRRMARHWLNATQTVDQDDMDDTSRSARGVLGSLTEDEVRRNDRASSRRTGFQRRTETRTAQAPVLNGSNNGTSDANPFAIFVDNDENQRSDRSRLLDESDIVQSGSRTLETEEDRKKENTMARERWNEQGAYAPTYMTHNAAPVAAAPLPAFAIHVDEDCAAENARKEEAAQRQQELMRRQRDERTFKEREERGVAERLKLDPLHYVKNPSQLEKDKAATAAKEHKREEDEKEKHQPSRKKDQRKSKRRPAGYQAKLLKGRAGQEQCFEEARAKASYFTLVDPSGNFNSLVFENVDDPNYDSTMSMDDSDVSMVEEDASASRPRVFTASASNEQGFSGPVSTPTPRNISTASSTVDEALAVGVPEERVEQTINTQMALRELSMMFSSPGGEANLSQSAINRSGGFMNQSGISEGNAMPPIQEKSDDIEESPTFENLGGGALDSSFAPVGSPRVNHLGSLTRGFHGLEIDRGASHRVAPKQDAELSRKTETEATPFAIFVDPSSNSEAKTPDNSKALPKCSKQLFSIYQEEEDSQKMPPKQPTQSFSIFIDEDKKRELCSADEKGDTASFSMFADELNEGGGDDDGETASLGSLFDGSFSGGESERYTSRDLKRQRDSSESDLAPDSASPLGDDDETFGDALALARATAISYPDRHQRDVEESKGRLKKRARVFPQKFKSLYSILANEGAIYNLDDHVVPRLLRKTKIKPNETIKISKSTAKIDKELGRGAYGTVTLLVDESGTEKMALKSQCPTDCLAWEYEILTLVEKRCRKAGEPYPFPSPFSYLGMANGGLLTMTASSSSGLTLLDLVNNYNKCCGGLMPEILAIHFAARMLHHIELLHHKGKILHCDVKCDNWVLIPSDIVGDEYMQATDLQLIDFGRAVDLERLRDNSGQRDHLSIKLTGKASREDMLCPAMRKQLPWSFDCDCFGICATIHVMLFGEHISLDEVRWLPKKRLHRYHQRALWTDVFETLLKIEEGSKIQLGSRPASVRRLRRSLEEYLSTKKDSLKDVLKRQSTFLWSKRPY